MNNNGYNKIICVECGCLYEVSLNFCPECGTPNNNPSYKKNIQGYAIECPNCGAPTEGIKICKWCKSCIPYIGRSEHTKKTINQTILECEFHRVAKDRNHFPYIICHIVINGHELMQFRDECQRTGLMLCLLGVQGIVYENFMKYPLYNLFYSTQYGSFSCSFNMDYLYAAKIANEILCQVYEVTVEQVSCDFEYGQYSHNETNKTSNIAAAAVGGVLLGALLDSI